MDFYGVFSSYTGDVDITLFTVDFPIVMFAITPIMIFSSMTNQVMLEMRENAGAFAASRWMTLKWRCILMAIALLTITYLCYKNWDYVNLFSVGWFERFEFLWNSGRGVFGLILFYFVLPIFSIICFLKSTIEVLCSHGKIKQDSFLYRFNGRGSFQFLVFMLFSTGMCALAIYTGVSGTGVLFSYDFIFFAGFYFLAAFMWAFKKTNFDFKKDFGSEKVVLKSEIGQPKTDDEKIEQMIENEQYEEYLRKRSK